MMGKPDFDTDISSGQILKKANLQNELKSTGLLLAMAQELHSEIERSTWVRLDSLSGNPCADY